MKQIMPAVYEANCACLLHFPLDSPLCFWAGNLASILLRAVLGVYMGREIEGKPLGGQRCSTPPPRPAQGSGVKSSTPSVLWQAVLSEARTKVGFSKQSQLNINITDGQVAANGGLLRTGCGKQPPCAALPRPPCRDQAVLWLAGAHVLGT